MSDLLEPILQGRDLVDWKGLSECFKVLRGDGVSYHTIQAWMATGCPHVRCGRRLLFAPMEVWTWYKIHFRVVRKVG